MLRSLLSGLVLAVCVAVALLMGGGSELEHVALLGAGLGAVIGLVPSDPPQGKLGGFVLGFIAAWIAFGIRAALLPDSTTGRAVAAFLVILICGAAAAVSAGRVPLWSTLVGAAAIVGAYETSYTSSPSQFLTASPQAASTVVLAAGFGFIGTSIMTTFVKGPDAIGATSTPAPHRVSAQPEATSTSAQYRVPDLPEAASQPDPFRVPALPEATSPPDPYSVPALPEAEFALAPYRLPALPEAASTPDPHPAPTGIQDTLRAS